MPAPLTRRQRQIYEYLRDHGPEFAHPPTLDELCEALGLRSRGSLHKHIQALVRAGLVAPQHGCQRGVRLLEPAPAARGDGLPLMGSIAAGRPIDAVAEPELLAIPQWLRSEKPCYLLKVRGDSMIEEGILDGDWVIIEAGETARNGEIVVALVDNAEVTLKRIEQKPGQILLHSANAAMEPLRLAPERVAIQGVLIAQMRKYR